MIHLAESHFFFISPNDWSNSDSRGRFLQKLLWLLDNLTEFHPSKLAWCVELDELLWSSPQIEPWRLDTVTRNKLTPIIYKRLPALQAYFEISKLQKIFCSEEKVMECCNRTPGAFVLKNLAHTVAQVDQQLISIILSSEFSPRPGRGNIVLTCDCHSPLEITTISTKKEWISNYDFINILWPTSRCSDAASRLEKAIQYTLILSSSESDEVAQKFLFSPIFTNRFISDLISIVDERGPVLEALGRRLTIQTHEATNSSSLEDETIKGGDGMRRMRVNSAARIHYKITATGMVFFRYYGESEHDDGI